MESITLYAIYHRKQVQNFRTSSSRGVWGKVGRRGKVGSFILNPNGATYSRGSGRK